jgi:hypothetical protein
VKHRHNQEALKAKFRLIFSSLSRTHTELKLKILSGYLSPEEIVLREARDYLSIEELATLKKEEEDLIASKRSDWHSVNRDIEGFFTCPECSSKKTTFIEQ